MDGLPVTVRLIDPPLHEFLPDLTELSVKVAAGRGQGRGRRAGQARCSTRCSRLHEQNPMLGLRGVRLGLVIPGLFAMQVRAIAEAAAELQAGRQATRRPEIMIPLVGAVQELEIIQRARPRRCSPRSRRRPAPTSHTLIGTMIEVPRAALTAGQIAEAARVLLLRHQRPDPDGLGLLPRRRRGRVLLPRTSTSASSASRRSSRSTARASAGWSSIAIEEGRADPAGPQARRLRRARRRPRLGALLPRGRPRLRVLLAVPGPGRPAGGRPRGDRPRPTATPGCAAAAGSRRRQPSPGAIGTQMRPDGDRAGCGGPSRAKRAQSPRAR